MSRPNVETFSGKQTIEVWHETLGKVTKDVEDWPGKLDWQLAFSYQRYNQEADLALGKVEIENPGLVGFNLFAARLTVKF